MKREDFLQYAYKTVEDFMQTDEWRRLSTAPPKDNPRAFHSTRLESMIFNDLLEKETEAPRISSFINDGTAAFDGFPSVARDMFHALYAIKPRRNAEDTLTAAARKINLPLLDKMCADEKYPALRKLCAGRELVAFEAMKPFAEQMLSWLELLHGDGGKKMEALRRMEEKQNMDIDRLRELCKQAKSAHTALSDEKQREALRLAQQAAKREQQIEYLSDVADRQAQRASEALQQSISKAITVAIDRAEQAAYAIAAWGSDDGTEEANAANKALIDRVKQSNSLRQIIKHLGRFRDLFENIRKNSFAFGRGDKYDITLGNDFSRIVSSEYAYLALPETVPLFIQKVQRKALKQYRKRERSTKGYGDIIICLDESGSMRDEPIARAKALALVLAEAMHRNRRSCAVIRFSNAGQVEAHVFRAGQYTTEDVFAMCESFFGGGTEYEAPLMKAIELIETDGFENADVVMLTDGECAVSDTFTAYFVSKKKELWFTVTGIVIDEGMPGMTFGLTAFCDAVYRTSELTKDDVMRRLIIGARVI